MTSRAVLLDGRAGITTDTLAALDDAERERYARLNSGKRKSEFALGRALAKALGAGSGGRAATIVTDDQGAPRFSNVDLHLSISHSQGWIAVAVSSGAVGIDIQPPLDELPKRTLGPDERAWVNSLDQPERSLSLGWLWTLKEAHGKLAGTGLRFPLPHTMVPLAQRGSDGNVYWHLFRNEAVVGAVLARDDASLPGEIEDWGPEDLDRALAG